MSTNLDEKTKGFDKNATNLFIEFDIRASTKGPFAKSPSTYKKLTLCAARVNL